MHVDKEEYHRSIDKKYGYPHLKTDERAKLTSGDSVTKKSKSSPMSKPFYSLLEIQKNNLSMVAKAKSEETKADGKKGKKKGDKKEEKEEVKAIPKPEPFLDFDKDIEIGDNMMIERILTNEQLEKWNSLKDDDDREDLTESNLKKLEKKFLYCHKDIQKKISRGINFVKEHSLISYETIAKDHPVLKFLNQEAVVDVLKGRDIDTFHMKKYVVKQDSKPNKVFFV